MAFRTTLRIWPKRSCNIADGDPTEYAVDTRRTAHSDRSGISIECREQSAIAAICEHGTAIPRFQDAIKPPAAILTYVTWASPRHRRRGPDDFEDKFLMVNRISNLITTRSDTFTVYIVIQGWRNAGTPTPSLVVQKRAAFIVDRNNITSSSGGVPKTTAIAND